MSRGTVPVIGARTKIIVFDVVPSRIVFFLPLCALVRKAVRDPVTEPVELLGFRDGK